MLNAKNRGTPLLRLLVIVQIFAVVLYPQILPGGAAEQGESHHAVAETSHHDHGAASDSHAHDHHATLVVAGVDTSLPAGDIGVDPCCSISGGICVTMISVAPAVETPSGHGIIEAAVLRSPVEVISPVIPHPPNTIS